MGEHTGMPGDLIYEYTAHITQVVGYGASADAVLSGRTPPPPEGARFDVYFEGPVTGPRVNGTVKGVDYLLLRADGRSHLHIHAEIATADGKRIALAADGVAIPEPGSPVLLLRENVTLISNHPEFAWVNRIQIWAPGTVDLSKGEIRIKAYAV
jgi:hypothetical protein